MLGFNISNRIQITHERVFTLAFQQQISIVGMWPESEWRIITFKHWNLDKIHDIFRMCFGRRFFSEVNFMWMYFTKSIYVKSEQVLGSNGLVNTVG